MEKASDICRRVRRLFTGTGLRSRHFHIPGMSAERAFAVKLVVGGFPQQLANLASLDIGAVLWCHGSCRRATAYSRWRTRERFLGVLFGVILLAGILLSSFDRSRIDLFSSLSFFKTHTSPIHNNGFTHDVERPSGYSLSGSS
jgi:hypothetical protein